MPLRGVQCGAQGKAEQLVLGLLRSWKKRRTMCAPDLLVERRTFEVVGEAAETLQHVDQFADIG